MLRYLCIIAWPAVGKKTGIRYVTERRGQLVLARNERGAPSFEVEVQPQHSTS